jgi:hypothetical protein
MFAVGCFPMLLILFTVSGFDNVMLGRIKAFQDGLFINGGDRLASGVSS